MANPIIVEKVIKAPAAKVWAALTDEAQMRKWYFDVSAFKPEVGFEFTFEGRNKDMVYHHLCRVTEVIPLQRLSYSWRYQGYPGDSLVTIELFDEGDATRVKLTHTGLETFPDTPNRDFARENFEMGWNAIIGKNLPAFVE
jgi:uncharacterized protein YndB with AHSA1/START domain